MDILWILWLTSKAEGGFAVGGTPWAELVSGPILEPAVRAPHTVPNTCDMLLNHVRNEIPVLLYFGATLVKNRTEY